MFIPNLSGLVWLGRVAPVMAESSAFARASGIHD